MLTSWQHLIYALHRYSPYVICGGHPHSPVRICKERLEKHQSRKKALRHGTLQPPFITAILICFNHNVSFSLALSLTHALTYSYAYTTSTTYCLDTPSFLLDSAAGGSARRTAGLQSHPLGPPDRGAVLQSCGGRG